MRKVKDILRLKFEAGLSHERIAAAVGVSKGAVTQYLQRAARAGVSWPVAPALDDTALEALLFPPTPRLRSSYAPPDFAVIHQELKRVTLQLLWEEYAVAHPGAAYGYTQFCAHYHRFRDSLKRSMRLQRRPGCQRREDLGRQFLVHIVAKFFARTGFHTPSKIAMQ